jgi:hypothetical protein
VWGYTPRQINGYLKLTAKRRKIEAAELLTVQAIAASGDDKLIKKVLKDWTKE